MFRHEQSRLRDDGKRRPRITVEAAPLAIQPELDQIDDCSSALPREPSEHPAPTGTQVRGLERRLNGRRFDCRGARGDRDWHVDPNSAVRSRRSLEVDAGPAR